MLVSAGRGDKEMVVGSQNSLEVRVVSQWTIREAVPPPATSKIAQYPAKLESCKVALNAPTQSERHDKNGL